MIFTRRFGALAARPNFRHDNEIDQEQILDVPSVDAELDDEKVMVGSAV
jgi:hypothetical protein